MYLLFKDNIIVVTASGPVSFDYLRQNGLQLVEGDGTIGDAVFSGNIVKKPSPLHVLDVINKTWILPANHLDTIKKNAKDTIDNKAGTIRGKYITTSPGQSETYAAKYEDAKAYAAAGYPANAESYPWVKADSEAYGTTPKKSADKIITLRDAWTNVGVAVEKARLTGKKQVEGATTEEQIQQIVKQTCDALELL